MLLEVGVDYSENTLPLDSWHRALGARMVPFAGYAMPVQYEGILAEHRWTRESAGLFDVSHMGQLRLTGADADKSLESLVPGDIVALTAGRLRYSLLLNADGGTIDDLMVTRRQDHLYLVVNGATKHGDIAHIRQALPNHGLEHMTGHGLLALQGPKAAAALSRLAPDSDSLAFMSAAAFTIHGTDVWISRSGYTGEDGFEISVAATDLEKVADLLLAQPEVRPVGLGARDSLRLEAGLPLYGHDLDERTSPVQAGLGFAISKRRRIEGGFPGSDRILAELEHGPDVLRVGLAVSGRQPVREGAAVVDDEGSEIGRVTSGGFSPILEAPIATAYVPNSAAKPGSRTMLSQRGRVFESEVAALPFIPHRYHRKGAV
jgi:aminomethyltransferase